MERLRASLRTFPRETVIRPELRHAAVAITLVTDQQARPCFLITRRAPRLRAHAGQWALPGGRLDAGETTEAAALRELDEELGLRLPADAILGLLDDYPTRSGYVITPVVVAGGQLDEPLRPHAPEVAAAYVVPVEDLAAEPRFLTIPESEAPVIQLPILGHRVHAPTAAVLYQFRELALFDRVTRVAHLEQPVFAWQ